MPRFTELELIALRAHANQRSLAKSAALLNLRIEPYKAVLEPAMKKAAEFLKMDIANFMHMISYGEKRQITFEFLHTWEKQMVTMEDPMF